MLEKQETAPEWQRLYRMPLNTYLSWKVDDSFDVDVVDVENFRIARKI